MLILKRQLTPEQEARSTVTLLKWGPISPRIPPRLARSGVLTLSGGPTVR